MRIKRKSLNVFTVCASIMLFILMWWGVVLIPTDIPYGGTFLRIGLTALLILLTKYFDEDLKIKVSEMYRNIDIKNLIFSLVGIFIYIFSCKCLGHQKICSLDFSNRDLEGYISLFFLALFEETFFRGWGYTAFWSAFDKHDNGCKELKLFNKFSITISELRGIIFTNLFFAVIHLQTYIVILKYNFLQTLAGFVGVFFVGTLFTLIFRKTKSVWNVVAVHFFWDYVIGLIV